MLFPVSTKARKNRIRSDFRNTLKRRENRVVGVVCAEENAIKCSTLVQTCVGVKRKSYTFLWDNIE